MSSRFSLLKKWIIGISLSILCVSSVSARDLEDIKKSGYITHIGVPYANFVTGDDGGLDVDLMQLYSEYIGVQYRYVRSNWSSVIGDLTGHRPSSDCNSDVKATIKGDVIANGLTVLPWRKKYVTFSKNTFPTQVWLITSSESISKPITPSGDIQKDIEETKKRLKGKTLLGKTQTCLDPSLYNLDESQAIIVDFKGNLNELAPAVIAKEADFCLLDVPDVLVALENWPSMIKVIGPMSPTQTMAVAFRKESPLLAASFEEFFKKIWNDGTYHKLVKKYYPSVFEYFDPFFTQELK